MRKQIDFKETSGKTIRAVLSPSRENMWLVVFEDDSFSCISIQRGWDHDDSLGNGEFDQSEWNKDEMVEFGFLDSETLHQEELAEQRRKEYIRVSNEQRERLIYERLCRKYGKMK